MYLYDIINIMKKISTLFIFSFILLSFGFTNQASAASCTVNTPTFGGSDYANKPAFVTFNGGGFRIKTHINLSFNGCGDVNINELRFNIAGSSSNIESIQFKVDSSSNPYLNVTNNSSSVITAKTLNIDVKNGINEDYIFYTHYSYLKSNLTSHISISYMGFTDSYGKKYNWCASGCNLKATKFASNPDVTTVGSFPSVMASNITNKLVVGSNEIADVTITANKDGDLKVTKLPISVGKYKNMVVGTGPFLTIKDSSGTTIPVTFSSSTGPYKETIINFTNGLTVTAGTSKLLKVFYNIKAFGPGKVASGAASLQVSFPGPKDFAWVDTGNGGTTEITGNDTLKLFKYFGIGVYENNTPFSQTLTN